MVFPLTSAALKTFCLLYIAIFAKAEEPVCAAEGSCGDALRSTVPIKAVNLDPEECIGSAVVVEAAGAEKNVIEVRLNGENEGVQMRWKPGCALDLAVEAIKHFQVQVGGNPYESPMYLYDSNGYPISNSDADEQRDQIETSGGIVHVLLDGESWVWPGVEIGHTWVSEGINYTTVSMVPKVIVISNALSPDTCESLIDAGKSSLYRSPERHYSEDPKYKDYRTSNTASLHSAKEEKSSRIRLERMARLPPGNCETLQLVRYNPGEWYKQHHDLFHGWKGASKTGILSSFQLWFEEISNPSCVEPEDFSNGEYSEYALFKMALKDPMFKKSLAVEGWDQWVEENIKRGSNNMFRVLLKSHPEAVKLVELIKAIWETQGGCTRKLTAYRKIRVQPNRHATLFVYLNQNFEGGETVFPRAVPPKDAVQLIVRRNGTLDRVKNPSIREGMEECSLGLRVEPVQGSAALFYSKKGNGQNDESSIHGGCPPVTGTKFGLNGFCWNINANQGYGLWNF